MDGGWEGFLNDAKWTSKNKNQTVKFASLLIFPGNHVVVSEWECAWLCVRSPGV